LSLRVEERETLERWARRPKSAQALAQRSRMVLECAAGNSNTAVAHQLGVTWSYPVSVDGVGLAVKLSVC